MAHHSMLLKNLTENQIYNYAVEMISVMLRFLRHTCNAIFCYNNFQFQSEGDDFMNIELINFFIDI